MPIAVVMDFVDATLAQYDRVSAAMGSEPDAPDGCLFHWVTATAGGIRITDVWESAAQFERFALDRIGPITDAVGVPWLTFYDVHGCRAAGAPGGNARERGAPAASAPERADGARSPGRRRVARGGPGAASRSDRFAA